MNRQAAGVGLLDVPALADLTGEEADVYCWRYDQLVLAGYSPLVADVIAADTRIDLHLACDLLARGCPQRTAYEILL